MPVTCSPEITSFKRLGHYHDVNWDWWSTLPSSPFLTRRCLLGCILFLASWTQIQILHLARVQSAKYTEEAVPSAIAWQAWRNAISTVRLKRHIRNRCFLKMGDPTLLSRNHVFNALDKGIPMGYPTFKGNPICMYLTRKIWAAVPVDGRGSPEALLGTLMWFSSCSAFSPCHSALLVSFRSDIAKTKRS